jgi:signal transduction histidine kinase
MWSRLTSRLYVRIWLAVVLTVAVLTAALGWAWRMSSDTPMPHREIVVRNQAGQVIAQAQSDPDRRPGQELSFEVTTSDGQTLEIQLPRMHRPPNGGGGPWMRPPFGFWWMLALVALAVALAAYPIIRRLTLRLEALQRGVERWGSGDLSARVPVQGRDEVAFLATRFNSAAERIQTLVETQKALLNAHKNLLANASHELRSPLARIRMGLELMAPTLDTGAAQRAEISRSITELDQLIDEILLASRLDSGQTDNEPMEVLDLTGLAAEECSRVNAELIAEAQAPAVLLRGSPRLLRRLLRNLLENARRYSSGDITLALSAGGTAAAPLAIIRVSDRGPGVPAAQRERIFEPFYRLPGASEREGGVGLGLALVKSIAERHGGTVRCEDNPGGGASFVVELPA